MFILPCCIIEINFHGMASGFKMGLYNLVMMISKVSPSSEYGIWKLGEELKHTMKANRPPLC